MIQLIQSWFYCIHKNTNIAFVLWRLFYGNFEIEFYLRICQSHGVFKETETFMLKYIYLTLQLLIDFLAKKHILILTLEDLHVHVSLVNVVSSSLR